MGKQRSRSRQPARRVGGERRVNTGYVIVAVIIVLFLGGFVALVVWDNSQRAASGPPSGVETVDVGPAGVHTQKNVNYNQTPPAGGPHDPVWQNSGFYSKPLRDENAVHTLEHGGVWITYQPDLPRSQVNEIRDLVGNKTCMLASPYKGLPSPVVASAWGKQLQLNSADDPALKQFIKFYLQGPQTPEPGAPCTGGTSATQ